MTTRLGDDMLDQYHSYPLEARTLVSHCLTPQPASGRCKTTAARIMMMVMVMMMMMMMLMMMMNTDA